MVNAIISQTALKLPLNAFFHCSRLQNHQNRKPYFLFVYILITDLDPTFTKRNPLSHAKFMFHFLSSVTRLTLTEFPGNLHVMLCIENLHHLSIWDNFEY